MRGDSKDYEVDAETDCIKFLCQVMKSVQLKEGSAFFSFAKQGLKVTSEDAKSVQLNAFLPQDLFEEYHVKTDDATKFRIQLGVLIECLELFNEGKLVQEGRPRMSMKYKKYGAPLLLSVQEPTISTECKIRTLDSEDPVDFGFDLSEATGKMIIKSEVLREVFTELDPTSETIKVEILVNPPTLRLTTNGTSGTSQIDVQGTTEYVEVFTYNEKITARH